MLLLNIFFSLATITSRPVTANEVVDIASVEYPLLMQEVAIPEKGFGMVRDIMTVAFKAVNIDARYEFVPMARNIWSPLSDRYAGTLGSLLWYDENPLEEELGFIEAYIGQVFFFYNRKRYPEGLVFSQLEDLCNYDTAVIRGGPISDALKQARARITWTNGLESSFLMLQAERVDLVASTQITGWPLIRSLFPNQADEFAVLARPKIEVTLGLIYSKQRPELGQTFEMGLDRVVGDGTYMQILETYYGLGQVPIQVLPPKIRLWVKDQ